MEAVHETGKVKFIVKDHNGEPVFEIDVLNSILGDIMYDGGGACQYTPVGIEKIGKVKETKTMEVFVSFGPWEERLEYMNKALAPFEVDGWIGRRVDLQDPRRFIKHENGKELVGAYYEVHFDRFVKTLNENEEDYV